MTVAVGITKDKIRDGDPATLAALCDRRGPAVLAYCEQVAARGHATDAAADTFARLRISVVAPDGSLRMEGDALLRHIVRRAAAWYGSNAMAARNGAPVSEICAAQELVLVSYVENAMPQAARVGVDEHLGRCDGCRAALRRLEAAERAFERPPRAPLPAGVVETLLRALLTAAPVRACDGNAAAVREEALHLLMPDDARAAAPAPPPSVKVPEAQGREREPPVTPPRRRPEAQRRAGAPSPPSPRVAPRHPPAAGSRRDPPTLESRAPKDRARPRTPPIRPAVALLTAAAVLGAAAVLWLSSAPDATLLPAPSAPVYLGGEDAGSDQSGR